MIIWRRVNEGLGDRWMYLRTCRLGIAWVCIIVNCICMRACRLKNAEMVS